MNSNNANSNNQSISYRDAGVDIEAGDALVEQIKPFAKRTMRPEVLGGIGGFGLTAGLGAIKQATGDYQIGLWAFAALGIVAWIGLHSVKTRWRTTWGSAAVTSARV